MDIVLFALVGIVVGGLINALADDLPFGRLPRRPRYNDGRPRPVYAWLGVAALLYGLWHSTPSCTRLNWRYPLTELATAGLMMVTELVLVDEASSVWQLLIWQAYAGIFVLLAVVDLERKRVLTLPVVAAAGIALLDAAVLPQPAPNLASALAGAVCASVTFSLIYLGGMLFDRLASGIETAVFGLGDVYLMALAGLILGFPNILAAMVLAIALGGIGAAAYLALSRLRGEGYKRFAALPYAPYILTATMIALLLQRDVSRAFFGLVL